MLTGRKIGEFLEMFWFQGFGDDVFTTEPFAEVNQTAALRTEGGIFPSQPVALTFYRSGI